MITLKSEYIKLRALEPEDINVLYNIENQESLWELSSTITPYSQYILKQYIQNSYKDIFEVRQLRLVIESHKNKFLGLIDLFDFDPVNHRAGLGILINNASNRGKGYAKSAVKLMLNYSKQKLQLHQIYVNINEANQASLNLFKGLGFQIIGVKKDWNFNGISYSNELLFQYILK